MASLFTTKQPIRIRGDWSDPHHLFIHLIIPVSSKVSPLYRLLVAYSSILARLDCLSHRLIHHLRARIDQVALPIHIYLLFPIPYLKSALSSHQAYQHTSIDISTALPPYYPALPVFQPH